MFGLVTLTAITLKKKKNGNFFNFLKKNQLSIPGAHLLHPSCKA